MTPAQDAAPAGTAPPKAESKPRGKAPSARPARDATPEPAAEAIQPRVALVLSDRSAAYERLARAVLGLLEEPALYDLSDRRLTTEDIFLRIADSPADAVIAIGLEAAEAAAAFAPVPVVYCQVFNFRAPKDAAAVIRGVAAIPPLSLQLRGWRELSPTLSRVGMIVG